MTSDNITVTKTLGTYNKNLYFRREQIPGKRLHYQKVSKQHQKTDSIRRF